MPRCNHKFLLCNYYQNMAVDIYSYYDRKAQFSFSDVPTDIEKTMPIILERVLNETEREIFSLYYIDNINIPDIADKKHVSKQRISKLRDKAISKIRTSPYYKLIRYGADYYEKAAKESSELLAYSHSPITILELSKRAVNILFRFGFVKLCDLERLSVKKLRGFKNLGEKTCDEIVERLECFNMISYDGNTIKITDTTIEKIKQMVNLRDGGCV